MLSFFRRASKSTVGTIIAALFLIAILASFAMGDIINLRSGSVGLGGSTLAKVGNEEITDREMGDAMQRRLAEVRQQNSQADYPAIAADFDPLLASLIDQRSLIAFADKYDFLLSKRLIDAEIAQIPAARGLNGQFNEQSYAAFLAQQHLTDQQIRRIIAGSLLQRLLLTPVAANARVSVGVAEPYAAMLLEARQGEAVTVPLTPFRVGLKPTDADLQRFYTENRARYMVPEQRVLRLAQIGPDQVASVTASDQEIAQYYNSNQDTYGTKEIRVISQAVVADRKTADAIAARARSGASFAAAAAPAGLGATDIAVGPQTKSAYANLAGDAVASAAFRAPAGTIVGPIQSDLGWHVVKIESVKTQGGKSLAAAHSEIAAKLTADKRKAALDDLVAKIQDQLDNGSNFSEAVNAAKLQVVTTPLVTANGASAANPAYRLPPEFAPALKAGFEIEPNDQPEVVALPKDQGYVMVSPAQVIPAAPAPLASIRDRVASDWIDRQALERARAVATAIAAKAAHNVPLAQAVKEAGTPLPPVHPLGGKRIQLAQLGGQVPPPLQMLFTLGEGKSRMVADPGGRGFFVVKVDKIVSGNALLQPGLIGKIQNEFQDTTAQEYAREFVGAVRSLMGVRRNDSAIAASRRRITG